MNWLRLLWDFLAGFIPAGLKSWWRERQRIKASQDKGAADQRAADDAADAEITAEAKERADELAKATEGDLDDRARRWGL